MTHGEHGTSSCHHRLPCGELANLKNTMEWGPRGRPLTLSRPSSAADALATRTANSSARWPCTPPRRASSTRYLTCRGGGRWCHKTRAAMWPHPTRTRPLALLCPPPSKTPLPDVCVWGG